jgi:hypothetical protein
MDRSAKENLKFLFWATKPLPSLTAACAMRSDRPKTFSAEYLAETNIRPVMPKTKKVLSSNFSFPNNFFRESKFLVYIVNFSCMYVSVAHKSFFPHTN